MLEDERIGENVEEDEASCAKPERAEPSLRSFCMARKRKKAR